MSKQQSTKLCWRCGPVSLNHRCESDRPRHRMRSQPVAGLSTGPQWGAAEWAAHYARGKGEVERVIGIDFGMGPDKAIEVTTVGGKVVDCRELGVVRIGDVYSFPLGEAMLAALRVLANEPDPRLAKVEALVERFRACARGSRSISEGGYDLGAAESAEQCANELEAALGTSKEGR